MSQTTIPISPANPSGKTRPSNRRRWAFRLCAILVALLPFVLLEIGLRLCDVANPTKYDDPFVGFSELHPQFERDEETGKYVTALSRQEYFGRQEFAAEKPANGFRAFCLGGSTVNGRPYSFETAFPQWMERELAAGDSSTQYEIINCGGISYASYRLKPLLKEVLHDQPDLVVLATGHNEFLEDRTYRDIKQRSAARQWIENKFYSLRTVTLARRIWDSRKETTTADRTLLPEKLDTRLDHPSGYASYHRDQQWRRDIETHFDHSLRSMIAMCRQADVPVILVRLGSNLRDCPPFKSEHKAGLTDAAEREWQRLFDAATQAESTDLNRAVALYRQAEKIDEDFALLSFRLARCLDRLQQFDEAKQYFLRAKEADICPLRLIESMSDNLAKIATETNTPLIDARAKIEQQAPQGIPGNDWYLDHVHPTIAGHQLIAHNLVKTLHVRGWVPASFAMPRPLQRREIFRRHFDALGARYLGTGYTRVSWLERWAKRERLLKETFPKDHRGRLRYGSRLWELGQQNGAWTFYEMAVKENAASSEEFLIQRALMLFQEGRGKEAWTLLERLQPFIGSQDANRDRLNLARLVLAIALNNDQQVIALLRESGNAIAKIDASKSGWLQVMPDALMRARKIAER